MPPTNSWLIGVSLTLTARIITNFGLQLQKHAHSKILISGVSRKYIFDPLWILGLILQISGGFSDFFALSFAPQSVIAPLGAVSLIINLCLTPIVQHETVSFKTIGITLLVVIGTMITVVFSPKDHGHYESIDDIFNVFETLYFLGYAVITASVLIVFWTLSFRFSDNPHIHGLAVPALSGMLSAQNVLFAKGVSTAITLTLRGNALCFVHWEFYFILSGLLIALFAHLKWLNIGLKSYSPIRIIPISNTFAILNGTAGGLVVFTEYKDFNDPMSAAFFCVGVTITTMSVFALSTIEQPVGSTRPDRTKYQLSRTNADLEAEFPTKLTKNTSHFDFEMVQLPPR